MPSLETNRRDKKRDAASGFSLLEMMVSVAIIMLLMSAVFPFILQSQKRFQGNQVISESNQSARAALEVMTQEVGQAGYNPQFTSSKVALTSISANGCTQFVQLSTALPGNGLTGISPGDWLSVGTGPTQETVEVFSTSSANDVAGNPVPICAPSTCACAAPPPKPWIQAKFQYNHITPYNISSYKMPYGGGLLYLADNSQSNRLRLEFYGDINQDGKINYVVYSLSPMLPLQTVKINGKTFTLYNLYRSITQVPFQSLPTPSTYVVPANSIASPMVEKVLFNTTDATACLDGVAGCGPTGKPIFSFPDTIVVGVVPNQITVVGTIVITLCVAVNPQSLETGIVQWYTMATQIRPLNLSAAINVNQSNGSLYLPPTPKSLPMKFPIGYYP